jgi:hypothetical protein
MDGASDASDASDEERPWSGGGWKRRERRTTINDARFLALMTMDISHPVLLGSSYSGDLKDLPGYKREDRGSRQGKAKGEGGGGDASVKEVIDLLECVSIVSMAFVGRTDSDLMVWTRSNENSELRPLG